MKWHVSFTWYEGITKRASCPEKKTGYPPSPFQVKLLLNWLLLNSEWLITCSQKSAHHYRDISSPHSWWDLRQWNIPTAMTAIIQPPGPWHIADPGRGTSRRLWGHLYHLLVSEAIKGGKWIGSLSKTTQKNPTWATEESLESGYSLWPQTSFPAGGHSQKKKSANIHLFISFLTVIGKFRLLQLQKKIIIIIIIISP